MKFPISPKMIALLLAMEQCLAARSRTQLPLERGKAIRLPTCEAIMDNMKNLSLLAAVLAKVSTAEVEKRESLKTSPQTFPIKLNDEMVVEDTKMMELFGLGGCRAVGWNFDFFQANGDQNVFFVQERRDEAQRIRFPRNQKFDERVEQLHSAWGWKCFVRFYRNETYWNEKCAG